MFPSILRACNKNFLTAFLLICFFSSTIMPMGSGKPMWYLHSAAPV
jgi:hypothetical protein